MDIQQIGDALLDDGGTKIPSAGPPAGPSRRLDNVENAIDDQTDAAPFLGVNDDLHGSGLPVAIRSAG